MNRHSKLVETIRKNTTPEWHSAYLPRIGQVAINCMPAELAASVKANECWVRVGTREDHTDEFRGTAEAVATQLLGLLKPPSKAVGAAAEVIMTRSFNTLRCEEMSAAYSIDEETVFKAMDYLADKGQVVNRGERGWFRA